MPASTLTRPEMASTWEERRVWLRVSAFTASRTSFRRPVWSVGEGGDAMMIWIACPALSEDLT